MASVNKVILIGNLTRDPELRYTPKGTEVCEIGLAVNRKYKVGDEKREEVTFVDITFWGVQGATIAKYMTKGSPLYVEGRLALESWEDKNTGQKRSRLKVVGDNFQFLQSGNWEKGEGHTRESRPATQQAKSPMEEWDGDPGDEDDDIPM